MGVDHPARPTDAVPWVICSRPAAPTTSCGSSASRSPSGWASRSIIENKAGAGGTVGMHSVLMAAPDGYTIGFAAPNYPINTTLYQKLPFDFIRDSVPIAGTMKITNVLVTHPSFPAKTLAEFVAHAKANPGKVNYGSGGNGTTPHLSGELLKMMTGINVQHVPYRGAGPAATDPAGRPAGNHVRQPARCRRRISRAPRCIGARRHRRQALGRIARRAGNRRDGAGLRGERLVRPRGPARHPARDRRQAQCHR